MRAGVDRGKTGYRHRDDWAHNLWLRAADYGTTRFAGYTNSTTNHIGATMQYSVHCKVHGIHNKDTNTYNVSVSRPLTKKERLHGGCPHCKKAGKDHESAKKP